MPQITSGSGASRGRNSGKAALLRDPKSHVWITVLRCHKDQFAQQGFVREVRERRIAAGVLLVDAHTGYFNNFSVLDRLQAGASAQARALPPTYLADRSEDRFASATMLAAALPPKRVLTTPGGHFWPAWRRLWQQALPKPSLPDCG